jgi:glutathione synthase/RimK-type ligase-like ATP-grasp enzyme
MLVGIHNDSYGRFNDYLRKYEMVLDYNGIGHIRLDASNPDFWEQVAGLDLFIFRWRHIDDHRQLALTLIPIIEHEMGINCFPNMSTCWHFDDKIREYYLLQRQGFPVIQSWAFWDRKQALEWLRHAPLPLVFKLKGGASSNNVILVKDKAQAKKLIKRMFSKGIISGKIPDREARRFNEFNLYKTVHKWGGDILRLLRREDRTPDWIPHKNYVFFQKFLFNNPHDTRVVVIGDRAFAFRRFNRDGDFRASGSGIIDIDRTQIDLEFVKIAFEISHTLKFQSMAYDFIYDENGKPALIEISYAFPDNISFKAGFWDIGLNWHDGRYCPQYFHLADTLNMPDLLQPPF